uniref:Uncharacterized protein n=1 Tax=Cucumis melo TaxID=3656 RepID=A0A9I9DF70_CUCME
MAHDKTEAATVHKPSQKTACKEELRFGLDGDKVAQNWVCKMERLGRRMKRRSYDRIELGMT